MYWYGDRQEDQWNRTEDPEKNLHTYCHLIFDKGAKNIQRKKIFLTNGAWINWRSACRKMQTDPFLSPCTKFKSKWIKDLHTKPDTLKLIEEKAGKDLEHIGTGEIFLNRISVAYALGTSIYKWNLIKVQSFCKGKDMFNRTKWQPRGWEKIFTHPTSDRGLISNVYKELKKLDSWESNNPITK